MVLNTNEIWQEFSDALRGFILKRVRDEDVAEDILQDAFMKIHKSIDKLKDEERLRSWLYQITRNSIIDYYRNHDIANESLNLPEDIPDVPAEKEDIAQDLAPCVQALMNRLPDKYKQPLVMAEIEGMTQKEIGQNLDLSLSGAKSRVQRAREKMKDLLLECCQFEFDRLGNIQAYKPKDSNCSECCGDPADD